jgi:hypothetical protein
MKVNQLTKSIELLHDTAFLPTLGDSEVTCMIDGDTYIVSDVRVTNITMLNGSRASTISRLELIMDRH